MIRPLAALLLLAPSLMAGSVTLAWHSTGDTNVVSYRLHYGGAPGTYTNSVSTSATNATVAPLAPGGRYYFAVKAITADGLEGPFSTELLYGAAGGAYPDTVPFPPTNIVLKPKP